MIVCDLKYKNNSYCRVYKGASLLYEIYTPEPVVGYDYLNFTALEDCTILFETHNQTGKDISRILNTKYSYDRVNWYDADNVEIQLSAGRTIFYKGEWYKGTTTSIGETPRDYGFTITGGEVSAAGSVMSMLGDKDSLTITQNGAFDKLFYECKTLVTAPELPATTLANYCYGYMFAYCISLKEAPTLPATTLAGNCYNSMFAYCISLEKATALPATTLVSNCYFGMFYACISLTTAPVLPATTLVSSCYSNMFFGCSSLNYIKALFTTTPNTTYTYNWVYGVAETGTFVKSSSATWDVVGIHGVPVGWVATKEGNKKYKITFNSNGGTIPRTGNMGTTPVGHDTYLNSNGTSGYVVTTEGTADFSAMKDDCPVKSGYKFTGWYDADGVMVYNSTGDCVVSKYWGTDNKWIGMSDLTLTAEWSANVTTTPMTLTDRYAVENCTEYQVYTNGEKYFIKNNNNYEEVTNTYKWGWGEFEYGENLDGVTFTDTNKTSTVTQKCADGVTRELTFKLYLGSNGNYYVEVPFADEVLMDGCNDGLWPLYYSQKRMVRSMTPF